MTIILPSETIINGEHLIAVFPILPEDSKVQALSLGLTFVNGQKHSEDVYIPDFVDFKAHVKKYGYNGKEPFIFQSLSFPYKK